MGICNYYIKTNSDRKSHRKSNTIQLKWEFKMGWNHQILIVPCLLRTYHLKVLTYPLYHRFFILVINLPQQSYNWKKIKTSVEWITYLILLLYQWWIYRRSTKDTFNLSPRRNNPRNPQSFSAGSLALWWSVLIPRITWLSTLISHSSCLSVAR